MKFYGVGRDHGDLFVYLLIILRSYQKNIIGNGPEVPSYRSIVYDPLQMGSFVLEDSTLIFVH